MSIPFNNQSTAEQVCSAFSAQIKNRTFLITGTSARGMGAYYAKALSKHGPAQILLVSRSREKVDSVITNIHAIDPIIDVKFVPCELTDQGSVRAAARTILDDASVAKIDVVINNAGVMAIKEYTLDTKGNELTLSANHIGHFLLTNLLMPKIQVAAASEMGARIINITSYGHNLGQFRFDDPNFGKGKQYNPWVAYGQSKTANILFSVELARRFAEEGINGIQAFAAHPGLIMSTALADHLDFMAELPGFLAAIEKAKPGASESSNLESEMRSESQGCASGLLAALNPEWKERSGVYVADCQFGEAAPWATDVESAKKLWAWSEEAVGQKFDV